MKKFTAMSVLLNVKMELAAANGNRQFTICVLAKTKKRVQELLAKAGSYSSLKFLNNFNGLQVNPGSSFTPPEEETIYFFQEHPGKPHFREWLKFADWKRE